MATVPPESTSSTTTTPLGRTGITIPIGMPFNSELLIFLLVWIVIALIWAFSDEVDASGFATLTVALTFGYLVSRGIAKASRVYE